MDVNILGQVLLLCSGYEFLLVLKLLPLSSRNLVRFSGHTDTFRVWPLRSGPTKVYLMDYSITYISLIVVLRVVYDS